MSFGEAIKTCFTKYACFRGRARRSEYWFWVLLNGIVTTAVFAVFAIANGSIEGIEQNIAYSTITLVYALATLLPSWGVAVRRMHDIGKSGWAILMPLIPLVGGIILLVWECRDSEAGENKYGPNPKA